ncbi:hypothetical protein ACFV2H_06020 [Streptomyces sp. NPDC059629]|uniref:hypothetical protein n=1 Tax=Streptomyces sp. NPDC059629 TaxID=3346889 RepID=UPI003693175E
MQERALDVVARRLGAAGGSVRPELRTAAARMGPGLAPRAAELLGSAPDQFSEPYTDMLPPVPEPRPVPDPIETVFEVAEELAAVVANDQDVGTFERVLGGLVRHAHLDRGALAQALKPIMRRQPRSDIDCIQSDVYDVAAALRGDEPRELHFTVSFKYRSVSPTAEEKGAERSRATRVRRRAAAGAMAARRRSAARGLRAAGLARRPLAPAP